MSYILGILGFFYFCPIPGRDILGILGGPDVPKFTMRPFSEPWERSRTGGLLWGSTQLAFVAGTTPA